MLVWSSAGERDGASPEMIVKETLPNGLTLVTESMSGVRSAAVGVWLKRGSRHEADEVSGVSHFI